MDFDTCSQWCPVCDRQIIPKRTQVPVPLPRIKRGGIVEGTGRAPQKMRTIIDQGPYPLYCSDKCRLSDLSHPNSDDDYPYVYPIYSKSDSSPSDIDSVSSDSSSPVSEESSFYRFPEAKLLANENRSRSFNNATASKRSSSHLPSSLPNDTDELLNKFSLSFSRRSESRVSLYGSSPPQPAMLQGSPPRRERPLLPGAAAGKLLVPDVLVRVPSSTSVSRPANSRRPSTSSLGSSISSRSRTGSTNSFKSPLSRYTHDSLDEEAIEDEDDASPTFDVFTSIVHHPRRPMMEARSWSYDNSTIKKPSNARDSHQRQSFNPEGKRLFLFPTD
ncbi:hypothetical protein D9758_011992 [Tetrapyrgos nigripes]|uniref:Uncharacterized protein n=1 Tax=Tetrapyrgos nigripes TaxID=182062 RepID=A0A8H5CPZ7_9AGAR|nr:hypothetical protein D9758_011992 [Tetrapyrgos nigripes]